jgi:outer membrane protein TolC
LTQPIFEGGTLLHRERAARAAYEQSAAQYRSTVVTALQNVADSLRALEFDADALKAAARSERAAARSLELVRAQLRLGAVNYLALLNAQTTYQQALINLVQAQAARFADTAALFQAMGGGWWNRGDVAATAGPEVTTAAAQPAAAAPGDAPPTPVRRDGLANASGL